MSSEVPKFLVDPISYASRVCINLQTAGGFVRDTSSFDANQAHSPAYFDLEPWPSGFFSSTKQVNLVPQLGAGPDLITGYYVPYLAFGTITSNNLDLVPLDNVPKTHPPYDFIFTGGQNGCSLLLLNGTLPNTVCALHYPNSDGKAKGYPLLERINRTKDDIILAIDFDLYGTDANPNACSFFYFDGNEWTGLTQPQVQGPADRTQGRPSMSISSERRVTTLTSRSVGTL